MYGLIDPRTNQIFYIGKGTGNRVFEHEKESLNNPDSDKLKLKTISEIVSLGLSVKKIIINSNLTESEAFAAEAALINAFNYVSNIGLTNIVAGHHSPEALRVEDFENGFPMDNNENFYYGKSIARLKLDHGARNPITYLIPKS